MSSPETPPPETPAVADAPVEERRLSPTPIPRPGELLLIRHAQSEANAGPCDVCDCGLTELGRQQAVRVGERLRGHFDLHGFWGITSPYRRARETADGIGLGAAIAFQPDEGCREWGVTCDVGGKHYPEEKLHQAAIRLDLFLKRLRTGGKYVIVSHATPVFLMIQLMTRGNVSAALSQCVGSFWAPITNCGVTHIKDGKVVCLAKQIG
jgi:broad specificity phosphatase PhoE